MESYARGGGESSSFFLSECKRLNAVSVEAIASLWNTNKGSNYKFAAQPLSVEAFFFARLIMRLHFTC